MNVKVLREGATRDFNVRLAELPTERAAVEKSNPQSESAMDGEDISEMA